MKSHLDKLTPELKGLMHLAARTASRNNMRAYLVGGFVRDLILGIRNLDSDIVIEGDGVKFAEEFAKALKITPTCHRRFGTATCVISGARLKVDIASARKEFYPRPGELPLVRAGTLQEDLKRRDFTINAMAISINKEDSGRLIDLYEGRNDLKQKRVRILHSLSFIDDPTRILRGIRFEQRYDFRMESETLKCLKEAAKLKMLDKISPQRIRDELVLILKEEHPIKDLKRIQELVGYSFIHPRLRLRPKAYNILSSIKNQIDWFKKKFPRHREPYFWLIYFMRLIWPLNVNDAKSICRKFVFRKGEERILLNYKNNIRKISKKLQQPKMKPSTIFSLLEPLTYEEVIFIKAAYKSSNIQKYIEEFFGIYNLRRISICGNDLKRLGIVPGPEYQKILKRVLNAKLDGMVKTEEEELALVKKIAGIE
ncbi:MAG: CCA tRNA nucleotidyltransferase [Candidatus Omnitrophota bacterium]